MDVDSSDGASAGTTNKAHVELPSQEEIERANPGEEESRDYGQVCNVT